MPSKAFRGPRTVQRPAVEEWSVEFRDPETGELMQFALYCRRGTFFDKLPKMLISLGYSPEQFSVDGEGQDWWRRVRREHR